MGFTVYSNIAYRCFGLENIHSLRRSEKCLQLFCQSSVVCLSVCLTVSQLATSHKATNRISMKILLEMYPLTKKN